MRRFIRSSWRRERVRCSPRRWPTRRSSPRLGGSGMNSSEDATTTTMRVLVVYEDSYRSYAETMVGAIRGHRPHLQAEIVQARGLEAEVGRFDPHLVICTRPNTVDPGG